MKKIIALCLLISLPSTVAKADWIMLSTGDRISGKIIQQNNDIVIIQNDALGEISINPTNIASIHTGQAPRVLARELRTGIPMTAPIKTATNNVPVPSAGGTQPTPPEQKAKAASDEPQKDIYKWSGRLSAGGTIQDGNSRSKTLTADADIKARDKVNRFAFGGEANWAEDDGEKTDNDQQIYGNYDRFITEKWFIGGRQTLEKDEFEELDLRSQTGLFLGHQFYEEENLNLQVKAGPEYIYEEFETGDNDSYAALGWALDYDQKINDNKVQIFHKHDIDTPLNDVSAFLFESETGARVPIGEKLDASAQIDFDWDNDPVTGVQEDDTTYAIKIGYGW